LNESKATRYQRLRRRAHLTSLAAGFGLLLVVVLTPAGDRLSDLAISLALRWPPPLRSVVASTIFVGALALAAEITAFLIALFSEARLGRRVRRSESSESVAAALIRDGVAGVAIALAVAGLARFAMWVAGPWWWALASLLLAGSTVAALGLLSLGLSVSGETRPLARTSLNAPLSDLARRACGRPIAVREWTPSSKGGPTAVVTGVGRAGKVLLSTEMARDWAEDEILVVVAHELSHHAHHDLMRKVAVDTALWCGALAFADRAVTWWGRAVHVQALTDLEALPLIALVAGVMWCLLRPLRLGQSRAHERRADRFALALTGNSDAFARALRRLGEAHLAEERPSRLTRWFFHRHPTIEERLAVSGERR
jgi:STE24 endopeptidase